MARDIKGILSKKGWTGEEVGRALIASLIHDAQSKSEGKDSNPLFTQAEFDRMENSLTDQFNFTAYGVFRDIYNSIVDCFNKGQGLYQQFYNGFYRYLLTIEQAKGADNALASMERYPLIMTQSQYDRIQEAAQNKKRAFKTSYRSIVFDMLTYYMGRFTALDSPERGEIGEDIPPAIKTALEATKNEPVTNKRILENWNEDWGNGYYTLPDGRRSDQMSHEEWQTAVIQEQVKGYELIIDGEPASDEEKLREKNLGRLLKGYKILFEGADTIEKAASEAGITLPDGVTYEQIIDEIDEFLDNAGKAKYNAPIQQLIDDGREGATWYCYTDPPTDLTKYDVIDGGGIDRYTGAYSDRLLDGTFTEEISEAAQFKEFIDDYPALYKALKEDIEARIPGAKGLKPAQHGKDRFSWGELADLDIEVYKQYITVDDADISEYYAEQTNTYGKCSRIWRRGIAIITNPRNFNIDEQGDYIEESDPFSEIMSIDNLANDSYRRRELNSCVHNLMKPALSYLYAYNALIDILAKAYALEGLEHLKQDLRAFESQLQALNGTLFVFYATAYGDGEEKKRKRALIRELFEPIYADELKPAPDVIKEMQERISGLGLTAEARRQLARFDTLIAALMERGE